MAGLPLIDEDTLLCPEHPLVPASTCRQCGAFYCAPCLPQGAKPVLCSRCNTTLAVREGPEELRRLFRGLWLPPLILGTGAILLFTLLGFAFGRRFPEDTIKGAMIGAAVGMPFILAALVIALTRSLTVAWIGVVFEVLCLLGLLLNFVMNRDSVNLGYLVVVFLAVITPLWSVFRILTIRDLQALLRAHAADPATILQEAPTK